MVLAHSLIGVPLAYYLIKDKKEYWKDKLTLNFLFMVAIIGAVFPDFDLALGFFIHDLNHRKLISHSVIPYLILFIFIFFLSSVFQKKEKIIKTANLIFFCSVLSHLILDYLVGGISLFAPLESSIYGLDIYFGFPENFFASYFTSWYVFGELFLILFSIFYIYKLREVKAVYLTLFFSFIAILMIFITR